MNIMGTLKVYTDLRDDEMIETLSYSYWCNIEVRGVL